jgi:cyclase
MNNCRLIARLDIKGPNLIKGVHLEGLRVIGDPQIIATKYYEEGIDEIIYIDSVASLYERNNLSDIVRYTANNIFIPMTVGGGLRSLKDIENVLRSGADKIAINTAAVKNPQIISEISLAFGSQCVVVNIEAKRQNNNSWEAYIDNGRERTGLDVLDWVRQAEDLGAGEILLTSVDQEGTRKGFDIELVKQVTQLVNIPVIASGGMGKPQDVVDVVQQGNANAVAIADSLHYERYKIQEIKEYAIKSGIEMRSTW